MAEITLEAVVQRSEIVAGHTVFEISDLPEMNFIKAFIDSETILPLLPVHYKYINTEKIPPRKFAVKGEFPLEGKRITLIG